MRIPIDPGELDLERTLFSGQVFRFRAREDGFEGVDGAHWYRLRHRAGMLEVESNATEAEVIRFFALDQPLRPRQARLIASDSRLGPLIERVAGLRLLRPSDPVETLFCFLCTANNHLSRIAHMVDRLAARGEPFGPGFRRFPTLDVLAGTTEAEWRAEGFGYRAPRIPAVAKALLSNPIDETLPFEELRTQLMRLPGVGPKLADCVALYAYHRNEATPMDTHLWQAVRRLYYPEWDSLTERRYQTANRHLRDLFGDEAAYAHLVLYHENQISRRKE